MSELTKMNLIAIVQQLPDEDIEYVQQYITILEDKLQQKENIIKEFREYIEEDIKGNYFKRYDDEVYKMCEELLKNIRERRIDMKKARYLIEYYRDEYNTLHQAILIDLDMNKKSNGEELKCMREKINPNLTILYETRHEDENHKLLDMQRLINDEWYEIDIKTFKPII